MAILYAVYTRINRSKLPLLCQLSDKHIVAEINPELHALQAPEDAEWFQYFSQSEPNGPLVPVLGAPSYVLDGEVEMPEGSSFGTVILRRSKAVFPYYNDTARNVTISSR